MAETPLPAALADGETPPSTRHSSTSASDLSHSRGANLVNESSIAIARQEQESSSSKKTPSSSSALLSKNNQLIEEFIDNNDDSDDEDDDDDDSDDDSDDEDIDDDDSDDEDIDDDDSDDEDIDDEIFDDDDDSDDEDNVGDSQGKKRKRDDDDSDDEDNVGDSQRKKRKRDDDENKDTQCYCDDNEEDMSYEESSFSDDGNSISANIDITIPMPSFKTDNTKEYVQKLIALYDDEADRDISFGNMVRRAENQKQKETSDEYQRDCKEVYKYLVGIDEALDPFDSQYNAKCRDPKHSMDKTCAGIYVEESSDGSGCKSGSTGDAKQRKDYRKKSWEKQGRPAPEMCLVVNIDSLSIEAQTKVSEMILDIAKKFMYSEKPRTIEDALVCDKNGLSFAVQDFFYHLVEGNAIRVNGYLRRCWLMILESGFQAYCQEKGFPLLQSSCMHEQVNGNGMARYLAMNDKVQQDVDKFLKLIKKSLPDVTDVKGVMLAWKPGQLPSQGSTFQYAKGVVARAVFGKKCTIEDAFVGPPMENPLTIDQCYNDKLYLTESRIKEAKERCDKVFETIENDGGVWGFDSSRLLWEKGLKKTLVTVLEERAPFGLDGPRWYVAWKNEWGIYVMKLDSREDNLVRMIIIFNPWCRMIFSKSGSKNTFHMLKRAELAALSADWVQKFVNTLSGRNEAANALVDKVLFHFYSYVHTNQMIHLSDRASGLTFKHAILSSQGVDCFSPAFTNMLRANDLKIVGRKARRKLWRVRQFGSEGNRTDEQQHAYDEYCDRLKLWRVRQFGLEGNRTDEQQHAYDEYCDRRKLWRVRQFGSEGNRTDEQQRAYDEYRAQRKSWRVRQFGLEGNRTDEQQHAYDEYCDRRKLRRVRQFGSEGNRTDEQQLAYDEYRAQRKSWRVRQFGSEGNRTDEQQHAYDEYCDRQKLRRVRQFGSEGNRTDEQQLAYDEYRAQRKSWRVRQFGSEGNRTDEQQHAYDEYCDRRKLRRVRQFGTKGNRTDEQQHAYDEYCDRQKLRRDREFGTKGNRTDEQQRAYDEYRAQRKSRRDRQFGTKGNRTDEQQLAYDEYRAQRKSWRVRQFGTKGNRTDEQQHAYDEYRAQRKSWRVRQFGSEGNRTDEQQRAYDEYCVQRIAQQKLHIEAKKRRMLDENRRIMDTIVAKSMKEYNEFGRNLDDPHLVKATLKPLVQHIISVEPLTLDGGRKELIGMYSSRVKMVDRLKMCERRDESGNVDLNRYFFVTT